MPTRTTGIQDDAPLTQTNTLAAGLELVSGLDFGSGLQPRNAVNASNEFTFSNVVVPSGMNLDVIFSTSTVSLQVAGSGLIGDVDRNGVVNFLGISPFIALLSTATYQLEADVNQDGVLNFLGHCPVH